MKATTQSRKQKITKSQETGKYRENVTPLFRSIQNENP